MNILLVATICLQTDPVTLDCRTEVMRMERTPIACLMMMEPVHAFLQEQTAGLPVAFLAMACKSGTMG